MINVNEISTNAPVKLEKGKTKLKTELLAKKIGNLQRKIYAEKQHAILIILQGMDASGKDGASRHVFGECSIAGTESYSFKKPTEEELAHDFLWRVHKVAPQKGMIMLFNRSHYEDILIQRVHKWIDEDRVKIRMEAINAFEELLQKDNNTMVLKFFLNISHNKQLEKLQERIDIPEKNWKHNPSDWEETKLFEEYMDCYNYAINESTTPWHIIPADKRWYRDYCIANIVHDALQELNPQLPLLKTNG